ncbi:MAG: TSUP family transporter [Butyricicoccus sp.]
MKQRVKYLVIGALAGAANGFFGSGGGLFLVPLLSGWTKVSQKQAFATSVAVVFLLSAVSTVFYLSRGTVSLSFAAPYLVGGFLGGLLSGALFRRVSSDLLRRLFGLLLLWGGLRSVLLW